MANITNAKWKLLTHSMSKTGEHKMLAGYQSTGGGMNNIFFVAPLYNLNDANMDGSVSLLERWYGANIYDPYSVFELFNDANNACCTIDAAVQLRDYALMNKARGNFLRTTHKAAAKAFVTINIEKLLSPGIELTLAQSRLAEMGKYSEKLLFLVQIGLETLVEKIINKSQGR